MSERVSRELTSEGEAINWRQTQTGVTIYDERNSDAWISVEFTAGIPPEHRLYMVCPECGAVFAHRTKPGHGSVCGDCGTRYDHTAPE